MRTFRCWWLLLCLPLVACAGASARAPARERMAPGLTAGRDDVANGLVGSPDPAGNPPAGGFTSFGASAFSNDGKADDVRARTENHLANPPAGERLLTYRGEIRVEVARPEEALARFLTQVKEWGGYLQNQVGTTVVVRIHSKQFEPAFVFLRGTGRVLAETRHADDVTEEFTDLGIRIENARKSLDRLREILQKADKVEDILKVEEQMRRLTEEIERMEGRRKLLADQVAMSTLQAEFQAVAAAPPVRRSRVPSRFAWINQIGAERVAEDF